MKVYVVKAPQGEYEDYQEPIVKVIVLVIVDGLLKKSNRIIEETIETQNYENCKEKRNESVCSKSTSR